eukprot:m.181694 g.181694  ORF g.181694 m.181694 type:complete len:112 (-) comp16874_c0_seq5:3112-3447(-)
MQGGYIVDYHSCDFFPERYFQLVLVLRTDNAVLWERLSARYTYGSCWGVLAPTMAVPCREYHLEKIQENVQAEIMQVVLEEARTSYNAQIVQERHDVGLGLLVVCDTIVLK